MSGIDNAGFLSFDSIRAFLQNGSYPDGISKNDKRSLRRKSSFFTIGENGNLLFNGTRVVIETETLKQEVLAEVHTSDSGGHCGMNKTMQKITARYYWLTIKEDVESFIASCDPCQRINPSLKSGANQALTPVGVTTAIFKQWGIDIVGPLTETARGNKYILAATDYFSKWPEATALQTKDARSVARFLFGLFCRYGAADIIISDQGREFVNSVNKELLDSFGVEHRITSPYHPQANGLQERMNQTLSKSLQKTCVDDLCADWDEKLDGALFAARTTIQKATKYSQFYIVFGREAILPIQLRLLPPSEMDEATEKTIEVLSAEREKLYDVVSSNILVAQSKYKKDYDLKHNKAPTLDVGMEVLLANCRKSSRKANKFSAGPNFTGPYLIDTISNGGLCTLKRPDGTQLSNSYNACHLRPYKSPKILPETTTTISPSKEGMSSSNLIDLTNQPDGPPANPSTVWILDLLLTANERARILDLSGGRSSWMNDRLLDAASRLLREKYGDLFAGLHDTILNITGAYSYPISNFVQVFLVNDNHWVCVSNIRSELNTSSIQVYDSLCTATMPELSFINSLARFVFVRSPLNIQIMNVSTQRNGCDCGLHAIATTIALCEGGDPLTLVYASSDELRQHFVNCLESKILTPFPSTKRSLPDPIILAEAPFDTYCTCRGVEYGEMVCCDKCNEWYHRDCIDNFPTASEAAWTCTACQS